jgi:hypothetical protein
MDWANEGYNVEAAQRRLTAVSEAPSQGSEADEAIQLDNFVSPFGELNRHGECSPS